MRKKRRFPLGTAVAAGEGPGFNAKDPGGI